MGSQRHDPKDPPIDMGQGEIDAQIEANAHIFPELTKGLDTENPFWDNVFNERILCGNETPRERRKKIHKFLHGHDRLVLPACADCQRTCKLLAPAGAEILLTCADREPIGETS